MTPAHRDARRSRRAARWIVRVGLGGGAVCLLVGAALYPGVVPARTGAEDTDGAGADALQAAPQDSRSRWPVDEGSGGVCTAAPQQAASDASLATWVGTRVPAALKHLAPAAFAVLGTMLLSVGAVFALLAWMGVAATAATRRHGMEAAEPRCDLPSPELHNRASAALQDRPARATAAALGSSGADRIHGPEPGQVRLTAGAHGEAAGPAATSSVGPHGARAAGPGSDEARRNTSTGSAGPTPHHATAPAFGDAARPAPGVQVRPPHAPVDETAPPREVDEPPPLEPARPGDLIDAWDEYRRNGDGHFSPRGLQAVLNQWGFDVNVGHGERVGAAGSVLVVETVGSRTFYVLPSFNKLPRAVADWFDDAGSGALTGRTQQVARVGRGRWLESGNGRFEVIERGEVR